MSGHSEVAKARSEMGLVALPQEARAPKPVPEQHRKLDVRAILKGAFSVPWQQRKVYVQKLWLPLGGLLLLDLQMALWPNAFESDAWWPSALLVLCALVLNVWVGVVCSRLVLLGGDVVRAEGLVWSWRECLFLWRLCVVTLITLVLGVLIAVPVAVVFWQFLKLLSPALFDMSRSYAIATGGLAYCALICLFTLYVFARLSPIFPATAVDRKVSLRWAWGLTRYNWGRLWIVTGVLGGSGLISFGLSLWLDLTGLQVGFPLVPNLLWKWLLSLFLVFEAVGTALAYQQLTADEDTVTLTE